MAIIDRTYDNIRVTGFVRGVPQRTGAILSSFLPNVDSQTRSFKVKIYDKTNEAAEFRAWDTPAPVGQREGFTEKTGKLPPMSQQLIIGEDETLGIFERAVAGDWDEEVEGAIFDDARTLIERLQNRMEKARGQVLETGVFSLTNENGLTLTADFGRDAGNAVSRSGVWSNPATDIVGDIRGVVTKSKDERDESVQFMLASESIIDNMLGNDGIRNLVFPNSATQPSIVSRAQMAQAFSANGLPQIVPYDYKIAGTRVITEDVAVFTPAPSERMGRTEWGVTAEALELGLDFGNRPGPVGVVMKNEDPVNKATKVTAIGMPVANDANLVYTMDTEA